MLDNTWLNWKKHRSSVEEACLRWLDFTSAVCTQQCARHLFPARAKAASRGSMARIWSTMRWMISTDALQQFRECSEALATAAAR